MPNTAKHTPGPWFYNYDDHCIVNQAGVSVVNVHGAMGGNDTNADIALIAAAPAMYALLQDATLQLARLTGSNLETYARTFSVLAKKALAQAEGKHD